jgi:hypothetical protein
MTILSLLISLIVIGVVLYVVNRVIPMDAKVKQILNIVIVVLIVLWLLDGLGHVPFLSHRLWR